MVDANRRNGRSGWFHQILTCDETGISEAFELVKKQLGNRVTVNLSLIYSVSENTLHPLFEKELRILEVRFPGKFFICFLRTDAVDFCPIQEIIEAIINSNTSPEMRFSVFGNELFVSRISEILGFLSVNASLIDSKTI